MTFGEYIDEYLITFVEPKRSKSTVESYRDALSHIPQSITKKPLCDINGLELQREINNLSGRYPRQAQILYTALSISLTKAQKLHLIPYNPAEGLEKPAHSPKKTEILTHDELKRYIDAAKTTHAYPQLMLIALYGLRRGEALGVRPQDITPDGAGAWIHITRQQHNGKLAKLKTQKSDRKIFLTPEIYRIIKANFALKKFRPISERTLYTSHDDILRRIGIDPARSITLHSLRHSVATACAAEGMPTKILQYLLGHSSPQLTMNLYADHITPDQTKKPLENMISTLFPQRARAITPERRYCNTTGNRVTVERRTRVQIPNSPLDRSEYSPKPSD